MLALTRASRTSALRLSRYAAPSVRAYHENIIDHYESPRNVGSFDKKDPNVGTGLVGAPACGDVMKLQMKVGADGVVEEAVFKVRLVAFSLFFHQQQDGENDATRRRRLQI